MYLATMYVNLRLHLQAKFYPFLFTMCFLHHHLDAVDVDAAHAAAAVYEEEQFPGGTVQLWRLRQQVRTEVEHQDRAAQDVLVVPLSHKLQLYRRID